MAIHEFIICTALGILICVFSAITMTGHLFLLHWYHYKRVTAENKKAFGMLSGLGLLLIGISLVAFSTLSFLAGVLKAPLLATVGTVLLIVGIVAGIALAFYAMFKYNKGIF